MFTIEFRVTPPFPQDKDALIDYKSVGQAVHEAGEWVAAAMRLAVSGTVFPGMTEAVRRPEWRDAVHDDAGLFEFTVSGPAELTKVEQDRPPYDMKPGLLAGPRHRVTKKGRPYTIVPFHHKASDLPDVVAEMASTLTLSRIVGQMEDERGVMRNVYQWGTNAGEWGDLGRRSQLLTKYTWKSSPYSRMYQFPGSQLLTFRTVSENSDPNSWWHPGRPGNPVTASVWSFMEPIVSAHIAAAWERVLDKWQ